MNNTVHSTIKSSPSKLMLGYDQRDHTDAALAECVKMLAGIDDELETERQTKRESAQLTNTKLKLYNQKYYNSKHKSPTLYQVGQYVLIKELQAKPGESRKLKPNYKGPYVITKVLKNKRYVVQDIPGFNVTARAYNSILSADKLKPWVKPVKCDV